MYVFISLRTPQILFTSFVTLNDLSFVAISQLIYNQKANLRSWSLQYLRCRGIGIRSPGSYVIPWFHGWLLLMFCFGFCFKKIQKQTERIWVYKSSLYISVGKRDLWAPQHSRKAQRSEDSGQRPSLLPLCGLWRKNSGPPAWQKWLLPTYLQALWISNY